MLKEICLRYMLMVGRHTYNKLKRVSRDPLAHNTGFLFAQLKENAKTIAGKKYNFKAIDSVERYKAAVPLTTYDDYRELVERMKKKRSGNLFAKKKLMCFASTSGSVGNRKEIPVSESAVSLMMHNEFMAHYLMKPLYKKARVEHGRSLFIISYTDVKTFPSGIETGDIAGMTAYRVGFIWNSIYTTPACSVMANKHHDFLYVHARFALTEQNLPCIEASYMTNVFEFANYIISKQEILFDDIEKGVIHEDINISASIRHTLQKHIKPGPRRAQELREIFKPGDYKGILKKIWPKLIVINAAGSASFMPYAERVRVYAGNDVAFYHGYYAASEGQIGMATEIDSTRYSLLPHQMFYEFIPVENMDEDNPDTLTIDRLELGKEYEIVITNLSGFYRYRIKDVVKVVGFLDKTPQVCFSYRRHQLINMAGEKTTSAHIESAVSECAKHFGCHITEFAVFPDLRSGKGHYTIVVEVDDPDLKHKAENVSEVMHEKLCKANTEITFQEEEGFLGKTEVLFARPNTFSQYQDMMVARGVSRNDIKPVRLIDTKEKEEFFFARLENRK